MIRVCDLHTHSTASDGQYAPAEVAAMAKERGVEVLALTDHDTVDGTAEAMAAGERLGLTVLPGIELGAGEYKTYHFLGYGYRPEDPGLLALCARVNAAREQRGQRIAAYLAAQGLEVPLEEVLELAGNAAPGRPHFAGVMVRRGYASSVSEAFARWLDTKAYYEAVSFVRPPARECVETVKAAGGLASLAHPYQIGVEDDKLEQLVRQLKDYGLDAIECRYPRYTPERERFYRDLARRYELHMTGGSDFHGERVKPDVALEAYELETDWLLDRK